LTYDREGRLVKEVNENEEGYVVTQTWDGYDQQGNWTVQTVTQSWRTDDEDEPSSKDVTRRSITYRRASNRRTGLVKK
jgi:YD repeat-containing protein